MCFLTNEARHLPLSTSPGHRLTHDSRLQNIISELGVFKRHVYPHTTIKLLFSRGLGTPQEHGGAVVWLGFGKRGPGGRYQHDTARGA
ncbi:hypothetical protein AAFF_G00128530 [Aldrovandia affinis]|uniref:Uncharacterized protein n=1 Tax=Aldrovandia affinis TaxID=143900 RepID=A0AAD7T161_9TELE|nr:hypothetical protein AAFF_G00128530 [Aldrovandia affinis]